MNRLKQVHQLEAYCYKERQERSASSHKNYIRSARCDDVPKFHCLNLAPNNIIFWIQFDYVAAHCCSLEDDRKEYRKHQSVVIGKVKSE